MPWSNFKKRHILNPAEEPNYSSWNRVEWNDWLKTRVDGDYGSKSRGLNSVIIGDPELIKSSVQSRTMEYSSYRNQWWSEQPFQLYILQANTYDSTNKYDVYNLGQMYFVAGLSDDDDHEPVHFQGQNPVKISNGQLLKSFKNYTKIN